MPTPNKVQKKLSVITMITHQKQCGEYVHVCAKRSVLNEKNSVPDRYRTMPSTENYFKISYMPGRSSGDKNINLDDTFLMHLEIFFVIERCNFLTQISALIFKMTNTDSNTQFSR